jgi:drug/metabolite transporter (DMT)-like permease
MEDKKNKLYLSYMALFSVTMIWGGSWPIGRVIAQNLSPLLAASIRYTIALPFFILFAWIAERNLKLGSRKMHLKVAILGIFQVSLYNFFYFSGVRFTSASDATLIISLTPTLTALIASKVHIDEKLNLAKILGLMLALSGVVLIILQSPNTNVEDRFLGNFYIFMASLTWALFTVFSKPVLKEVKAMVFTAWGTIYGWIVLVVLALFVDFEYLTADTFVDLEMNVFLGLIYLAILAGAAGNIIFNSTIKKIGSSNTAIFVNFVPVFGITFSVLFLGELFSLWYLVSFVLIFTGVTIVNRNVR